MNLLVDPWLPFEKRSGEIAYQPVSAITSSDVVDLALPRLDFQGAAYQFLIGLLQTAYAPSDIDEWIDKYLEPPAMTEFEQNLESFRGAFWVEGEGPLFMQDYSSGDGVASTKASSLLIDAPGVKTIVDNKDHFSKGGHAEVFCLDCAVIALFTIQVNGPAGGSGHFTGLRGGGPLTTLVLPDNSDESLWRKLWLNVIDRQEFRYEEPNSKSADLFPWMGPTRNQRKGQKTLADDVHELHQYWAMPRRFRFIVEENSCLCDLCGRPSLKTVSTVTSKTNGNDYDGPWRHPLTPYRKNTKKIGQVPLSQKAQPGGIGYRHWQSLLIEDREISGDLPALVVLDYSRKVDEGQHDGVGLSRQARIWVFGYDMDNMKPRGWYGTQMPLLAVPRNDRDRFLDWIRDVVGLAHDTAKQLHRQVTAAWFSRSKGVKGNLDFIDARFWERTEHEFYSLLSALGERILEGKEKRLPADLAAEWYKHVRLQAMGVFDDLALSGPAESLDMKRITSARNRFMYLLKNGKVAKHFRQQAGLDQPVRLEEELEQSPVL